MKLVVGLGNPGEKYKHTRHNVGFMVLNQLQKDANLGNWTFDKGSNVEVIKTNTGVFVKPQTFMNESGSAVYAVLKNIDYPALSKRDFSNVFVVYDDLDLPVGKYKLQLGTGPKVHNGVNSIKERLGSDQFWHIRIGTDGRQGDRSMDPEDYVLSGFTQDEWEVMQKVIGAIVDVLQKE